MTGRAGKGGTCVSLLTDGDAAMATGVAGSLGGAVPLRPFSKLEAGMVDALRYRAGETFYNRESKRREGGSRRLRPHTCVWAHGEATVSDGAGIASDGDAACNLRADAGARMPSPSAEDRADPSCQHEGSRFPQRICEVSFATTLRFRPMR